MKKLFFIVLVLIVSTSCERENIEKSQIDGVWIETTHKMDTIVFENTHSGMILKRGTEIRNGYLLPKYSSGPYSYEIKNDSISLHWMASSSSYSINHYFDLDSKNNEIKIGNFFIDSIISDAVLTFKKVQ